MRTVYDYHNKTFRTDMNTNDYSQGKVVIRVMRIIKLRHYNER